MSDPPISDPRPDQLDADLRALFDAQSSGAEPTPDELAVWLNGDLDSQDEDRLMERIADHPEAMDLVLDMRRGLDLAPAADESVRAVDSVMAAIGEFSNESSASSASTAASVSSSVRGTKYSALWAAAAVLVIGLSMYSWIQGLETRRHNVRLMDQLVVARQELREQTSLLHQLTDRLEQERQPQARVQVAELFASGRFRSGSPDERVELPASQAAILILTPQDPIPGRSYGISILDADQRPLWSAETAADDTGVIVISLPAEFSPPGRALLELTFQSQVVERFSLLFVAEPTPETPP